MPSNSKPCHNCRRRRLRCDRSWPTCHKCAVSGQECLGYGKVFVWTQGIDARGILKPSPSRRTPLGGPLSAGSGSAFSSTTTSSYFPPFLDSPSGRRPDAGPSSRTHDAAAGEGKPAAGGGEKAQIRRLSPPLDGHGGDGTPSGAPEAAKDAASSPAQDVLRPTALGSLTDPLFQDLDRNSRYYLAHFADRVCKDLVARDGPGANPFRDLIPLTNRHPLLLQILIATSAIHWSNIFRPITAIPTGLTNPGGYLAQLRSKDLVSRQALIDALTAKQKAMGHLQEVLDTLDPGGSEVVLAAMHFFIKFDLIDLEKNDAKGWRAHLEGASSILALLRPGNNGSEANRMLRDCVVADCFIYHILGSTLASGSLAANIARYAFELLPVMKRVEVNSYLSCPPEILHIILLASKLSYETPCTDWSLTAADEALALIDEALAFDIPAWADKLRQNPRVQDIQSRIHIASAHRSAACLYILQALPLARAVRPVDTEFLVGDILGNLGQISIEDPYYKATSWPTFIAGAETRDAEKRTWAMKRLLGIWETCPWGYLFTAIELLKAAWEMQDANHGSDGEAGINWLQGLKSMGFDALIV
ncbi:fungal-specific transcription factor domain-containing protein [Trichoderma novae-zelandiae]